METERQLQQSKTPGRDGESADTSKKTTRELHPITKGGKGEREEGKVDEKEEGGNDQTVEAERTKKTGKAKRKERKLRNEPQNVSGRTRF